MNLAKLGSNPLVTSLALWFCCSGLRAAAAPATVHDKLDEAVQELGDEIALYVRSEGDTQGSIMLGTFEGPANSGAGARIVQSLRGHLKDKVNIVDVGGFKVTGEYLGDKREIDGSDRFVIVIDAVIKNSLGSRVHALRKKIVTDLVDGISLFGPSSVDLSLAATNPTSLDTPSGVSADEIPVKTETERVDRVVDGIVNPKVHLEDTVFKVSDSSPYGIEVLVKSEEGYAPCPIDRTASAKGIGRVNINPDQVFAIRVHNRTKRPVGVELTIDGINTLAFSDRADWRRLGKWVIVPGRSTIKGWHHHANVVHEFLITKYGDSAAARFSSVEGVGTITATFFETFKTKGTPPQYAAGLGKKAHMEIAPVPHEIGSPLGPVSVRYIRPAHPPDLPPGS